MISKENKMKYLLIFFILISAVKLNAQIDQKAKVILDQVSAKTKSFKSITADFVFVMENTEVDLLEENQGSLIIQNDKYKLSLNGVEIMCDGESQWTYMQDAEEVNISEANIGEDQMINPATIFTIYENGFVNTYLGEFTSDSKKTYKIELVPVEINEFNRVILEIEQNTYQILSATMFGTDGNKYSITVNNMETTKTYQNNIFTFDASKHPNVSVIDMR